MLRAGGVEVGVVVGMFVVVGMLMGMGVGVGNAVMGMLDRKSVGRERVC